MKSVKVHDDTHRALKRLKAKTRRRSIDRVIKELIKESTGEEVADSAAEGSDVITKYVGG
jgi:predicted CopG family antitoxin